MTFWRGNNLINLLLKGIIVKKQETRIIFYVLEHSYRKLFIFAVEIRQQESLGIFIINQPQA